MRSISILFLLGLPGLASADQHLLDPVEVTDANTPSASLDLRSPTEVGSWLGLSGMELPASTSSMHSVEMADRDLTRAQDAAIRMPGITETPSPGNGGTALAARGFVGHNSVAQLVNGSRLVVGAGTTTYPFSAWPLESVQVLRGPASVLYGDGAIGAAVNYITKKPIWDWSERDAFFPVGCYGLAQGGIGLRGPLNDKVAYSLYLDGERSDGYRRFEDVERYNYSLAVSAKLSPSLTASLSFDGGVNDDARYFGTPLRDGELLSSLRRTNFNVKDSVIHYDDRVWRATLDYQAAPGLSFHNEIYSMTSDRHWRNVESYAFTDDGSAVQRSAYIEVLHDQNQIDNPLTLNLDRDIVGHHNRLVLGLDSYRIELEHINNSPYGGTSLVAPFDVDHGVFDSTDPTTLGHDTTLRTTAVFMENALDLTERWTLDANLAVLRAEYRRFDQVGPDSDTISRDGNVPSCVPERTANLWSTWRCLPAWAYATWGDAPPTPPTTLGCPATR